MHVSLIYHLLTVSSAIKFDLVLGWLKLCSVVDVAQTSAIPKFGMSNSFKK